MVAMAQTDPRSVQFTRAARTLGYPAVTIEVADLYLTDRPLPATLINLLVDPLVQRLTDAHVPADPHVATVDVLLRDGVTDAAGAELQHAAARLGSAITARSGRRFTIRGLHPEPDRGATELRRLVDRLLANPVIERAVIGGSDPATTTSGDSCGSTTIERIELRGLDDAALTRLSNERGLSLDTEQMRAIAAHFTDPQIDRPATDAELETLAQTWSEHCAHTTFRADIDVDGRLLTPLLRQLRDTTEQIAAPWVVSCFVGNAGIVAFSGDRTIALKAETHNHPSAVEPFGGANTGVGGVIRDVLGAAHDPIAITDILCFGPADTDVATLPDGVLHPTLIRDGVIAGVADYGNKIGLPTVAGAVLYDPGYVANPLVYAGCIGVAPSDAPVLSGPHDGDLVVVIGGRTGRDGIRGATFSSRTMDAATGEVAGASVQIGDPIVEKLLIDVLAEARGLYTAITDCGAGGLSSAVGEMAEGHGVDVDLALVPLKYAGLAPWEIWLSEAQERMVLAVADRQIDALQALCERHGVELSVIGTFNRSGRVNVRHGDQLVVDLDVHFLHDGRPSRRMHATWPNPQRTLMTRHPAFAVGEMLMALLGHPNIASKASVIRRYDHEIGGATAVRPLVGKDGHGDGTVLRHPHAVSGLAIGIGVNPWYGLIDPEHMAHAVVDEAIRNAVAVGADPDKIALLDNFSWGDPRRAETLGALAAAVRGCCDAALDHGAPFVSGKDSLNNEYLGADGLRHAVPPTLVITAVGDVPGRTVTADLKRAGNDLLLVGGRTEPVFGGSHVDLIAGASGEPVPPPDPDSPTRFRRLHQAISSGLIHACHDISEGGIAVAVAEMAIGGGLGATIGEDDVRQLFGERTGSFVVEVDPTDVDAVTALLGDDARHLGVVVADPTLTFATTAIPLATARQAWNGDR